LRKLKTEGFRTFITIEPIMNFDVKDLLYVMEEADPDFINIGADSKNSSLDEPPASKVKQFAEELIRRGFEIGQKKNLERLLKG
jgi:hypothetical protein